MIQRIQSIFLFLAGGASFGLFGLPVATTDEAKANSQLFADAAFEIQDGPFMMGLFALAGLVLLVTIFLFNNRKLQMSLTKLGVLLTIIGSGLIGYRYFTDTAADVADPATGIALPFLALIFGALAHRFINKDEKLVRSVDRLR